MDEGLVEAKRGVEEAVIVPLLLSDAFHAHAEFPALVAQIGASVSGLKAAASRPIGPQAQLLSVVDRRLRDALRARGVTVDGDVVERRGAFGTGPSLYVQDPDGYRIELKPR